MIFDRFITVDWSANNRPKVGPDSIWICNLGPEGWPTVNPRTRGDAEARIRALLVDAVARRERVLDRMAEQTDQPSSRRDARG